MWSTPGSRIAGHEQRSAAISWVHKEEGTCHAAASALGCVDASRAAQTLPDRIFRRRKLLAALSGTLQHTTRASALSGWPP